MEQKGKQEQNAQRLHLGLGLVSNMSKENHQLPLLVLYFPHEIL